MNAEILYQRSSCGMFTLHALSTPLKLFISSTRSLNWTEQRFAKLQLTPLFLAANRNICAKYMTFEVLQLNRIPAEVEEGFADGMYTANLSGGKFSNV